ncbi:MAG: helix-turn-helix transcriptional regulator [Gemmatimonadetes bacterium]|nr:helix-turn-helix transcriptional regulator [Gemmatimonadota bacterium]
MNNRVREKRQTLGMTQGDLAAAVGVSRQSINSIERERYIPSLPLALRFARVFGCTVDELFQLED